MSEALRVEDLTVVHPRANHPAVAGIDLAVPRGQVVSLLGPSGCGKTTTMRAIAGLITPSSGRIIIEGRDVTGVPAQRRGVGMVFQSYALFPHLTASENIAFGLRQRGVGRDQLKARVQAMLDLVDLSGLGERYPRELSGGQQQRVALARALAVEPRLLLLDEPLSNLDARLRIELRSELRRIQGETGTSMLYVTHDLSEALGLSDWIVVMRGGRIEQEGTPEELYQQPRTVFVARFMGFENIVPADRLSAGGSSNGAAFYGWRPNVVRLGQGPFKGVVQSASYQGAVVEYALDSPFGRIRASASELSRHDSGVEIWFDLPVESGVPLSG